MADGSNLFRIRRIFGLDDQQAHVKDLQIEAMAVHSLEQRQLLALAISSASGTGDDPSSSKPPSVAANPQGNYLVLRAIEEDQQVRFWRFPVRTTGKNPRIEKIVALEFSPEGDWLAALSSRKNRLHLLPVLKLVNVQRRKLLEAATSASTSAGQSNRELMGVQPSVMGTQMASYLRATNEAGGLNGARYNSQVAGDDEQMSTMAFSVGIGTITCVRWWRSMNSKNYCLVGSTENLVSIVNVEENAEECRCELLQAGEILSIDLIRETFRKEQRTTMLVKGRGEDGVVRNYRVVLEKKTLVLQRKPSQANTTAAADATGSGDNATGANAFARGLSVSTSSFSQLKNKQYVVKTFPEHFLEDMDFRPQRIKKDACLYAINGMLSTESSLALYDPTTRKASLFSNFQWNLKGEYDVPDLRLPKQQTTTSDDEASEDQEDEDDAVVDVELSYCSSDLMLLQGRTKTSHQVVSTWVSLPSHQGFEEVSATAHIVHYLSLHGNEKIERVEQTTSKSNSSGATPRSRSNAEIIYMLQTKHHVYECRPRWSRLALFKALCARTIALGDAQSIGYALGIDMASLCQVVADTLCAGVLNGTVSSDEKLVLWVRDLYDSSRVMPSQAVKQLTTIGGTREAIAYAQEVLSKTHPDGFDDAYERRRVALVLVDLVLKNQLERSTETLDDSESSSSLMAYVRSDSNDATHEDHESEDEWLMAFFENNRDYMADDIVDLCLSHHQVDKALLVASKRQQVHQALQKIIQLGLTSFVSIASVRALLSAGYASVVTAPANRLVLRSFPVDMQVEILLTHAPAIMQQRDWILRNVASIPTLHCRQLANMVDPRAVSLSDLTEPAVDDDKDASPPPPTEAPPSSGLADVAMSEWIPATAEEQVELFLTLLLQLNKSNLQIVSAEGEEDEDEEYSQAKLEQSLKELVHQYRPPIVIARCVDYENWIAAACVYEAYGEVVDAVECRLHAHKVRRHFSSSAPSSPTAGIRRRRQSSETSVESFVSNEDPELQDQMRQELMELLDSLVVRQTKAPAPLRAAILARLLVKWFEYGLEQTQLETHLTVAAVYAHVAPLLARIFFSEVVDGIQGVDSFGARTDTRPKGSGFEDRDKEWVRKCHHLPFSGQFLFQVCVSYLEKGLNEEDALDDATSNTTDSALGPASPKSPLAAEPTAVPRTKQKLLDLVKENIVKNDVMIPVVTIAPHSAQAIGKSDPLETHVKVFTCGHVFPKRVFEEDVLVEFDARMSAFAIPLFTTKQLLLREFKRNATVSPCPVCCYNKISALVNEQSKSRKRQMQRNNPTQQGESDNKQPNGRQAKKAAPGYYFLHRPSHQQSRSKSFGNEHEPWVWKHAP